MWLLRYTRYCICDTVPPCRAHVHMFTIIQFLRTKANIHTVLGAKNMFIVSMETMGQKIVKDQSLALYAVQKHSSLGLCPWDLCFYIAYIPQELVNIYYLCILLYCNKWGISVIHSLPEGYKGIYDPYIPPCGYYFDQSEPLFQFIQAVMSSYLIHLRVHQHSYNLGMTVDIVYTDTETHAH